MSDGVTASRLIGLNESSSSVRSKKVFQDLFASSTSSSDLSAGLPEFRGLLEGLKLRHEAIVEDRASTEESAKAYEERISGLRQQLESKSRELEDLKSKYQAEERIVRLAQECFDHPQWIDVGGEEVRMILNRTQEDLTQERKLLENEVSELEEDVKRENHELTRRLDLTNTTLNKVVELRSKIEMPREQREQIFGRDDDDNMSAEEYAADAGTDALSEATLAARPITEAEPVAEPGNDAADESEARRDTDMMDEDDETQSIEV